MNPRFKTLIRPGPLLAGAVVSLPMAVWAAEASWGFVPPDLSGFWGLRLSLLLIGGALLSFLIVSLLRTCWGAALAAAGALILLICGFAAAHWWFQGTLSLGEGEPGVVFESVTRGAGGAPPAVMPGLVPSPAPETGPFGVAIGNRAYAAALGQWVRDQGVAVRIVEMHTAPAFTLTSERGRIEDQLLVKFRFAGPQDEYFQMGLLPYRFYISLPNGEAPAASGGLPAHLSVRVMRGKLTVARGTLGPGEPLAFEAYRLAYEKGAPWAVLEVRCLPPLGWAYALGASCLLGGLAGSFIRRRTAP